MVDPTRSDASTVLNGHRLSQQLPSTEHLVALVSIARLGSITKAAVDLGLSQPALSRQIIGLQRALGLKLFERVGRNVRLTPAGEELVARASPLLEELGRITGNLTTANGTAAGRIRLGTSESVAVNSLPGIIRAYVQAHRRVQLRLVCQTSERLPDMVSDGELDIAVCPMLHQYDQKDLTCTRLWDEDMVLVLPIQHTGRSRTITSYLNEDFVLLPQGTETRQVLDQALAEHGVKLRAVLEHDSTEVIKAMVIAGLGLTLLPEPNVRKEARRGELAVLPLSDLKVSRTIYAIRDARRQPWPAEIALIDMLRRFGR
ncbi:MAG: LysR family transcriptional regulator [Planctomycetota bacterium]